MTCRDDLLAVAGLVFVHMIGGLNYVSRSNSWIPVGHKTGQSSRLTLFLLYEVIAHGMGRHASTISQDDLSIVFQQLLAFECLYVVAVSAVKLSILALYLRIFPSRGFKIASWTIGGTVIAWCIAIILVCVFQCSPIYVAWAPWEKGVCIDLKASFIGNAVPNIVTDVAILLMYVL